MAFWQRRTIAHDRPCGGAPAQYMRATTTTTAHDVIMIASTRAYSLGRHHVARRQGYSSACLYFSVSRSPDTLETLPNPMHRANAPSLQGLRPRLTNWYKPRKDFVELKHTQAARTKHQQQSRSRPFFLAPPRGSAYLSSPLPSLPLLTWPRCANPAPVSAGAPRMSASPLCRCSPMP